MDASDYRTVALAEGEVNSVEVGDGVPDAPPREPDPGPSERALEAIAKALARVTEAKAAHHDAAEAAKAAKRRVESAQEDLESVIGQHTRREPLPLFDGPQAEAAPDEPAGWRETPLAGLGLADGILSALAQHVPPILTLGHLTDFTNGKDNDLRDIRGIGEASAEAIREASVDFWASRRDDGDDDGIPEDVRHLAPAEGPDSTNP